MDNDSISPTRIQFKCNTSYDKLTKYLKEMKDKEIIDSGEIKVTDKGRQFHKDYSKINDLIQELSIQN
jgi:predicted transcriptional regulator